MEYKIDKFGFLRRGKKIIGWRLYDLLWANGWLPKKRKPTNEGKE